MKKFKQKLTHSFQSNSERKSMRVIFDKDEMNFEHLNSRETNTKNQSWLKVQLLKLKDIKRFEIYYFCKIYRLKLLVR